MRQARELDQASDELLASLKSLMTRGLNASDSFPPTVLATLRIRPSQPGGVIQEQLRRRLFEAAQSLDELHRGIFCTVAGLNSGSPNLAKDRVQLAVRRYRVSRSTIYRQYLKAAQALVSICIAQATREAEHTFIAARMTVDMSGRGLAITSARTVLALKDGLRFLDERIRLPLGSEAPPKLMSLLGCRISVPLHHLGASIYQYRLELERELSAGERHSFAITTRFASVDDIDSVIGFQPAHSTCDGVVKFVFDESVPSVLQRYASPPPVDGLDRIPGSTWIRPVTKSHVVHFPDMRPGMCYGVRWHWDDPDEAGSLNSVSSREGALPVD